MRKLCAAMHNLWRVLEKQTSGSETSQYREEKKPTGHLGLCANTFLHRDRDSGIPLIAASETGEAQTDEEQSWSGL